MSNSGYELELLDIGRSTCNFLKNQGISDIKAVAALTFDELIGMQHIGKGRALKILQELNRFKGKLPNRKLYLPDKAHRAKIKKLRVPQCLKKGDIALSASIKMSETDDIPHKDVSIDSLDLTLRTKNALLSEDITTLGQIFVLANEELFRVKNIGVRRTYEIRDAVAKYEQSVRDDKSVPFNVDRLTELLYLDINRCNVRLLSRDYICNKIRENIEYFDAGENISNYIYDKNAMTILYDDVFMKAIKHDVIYTLSTKMASGTIDDFKAKYLPQSFMCLERTQELFDEMVANGEIDFYVGKYTMRYESLDSYIEKILPEKKRDMVKARLSGKSTREIDKEFGFNRNGCVSHINSVLRRHIKVYENRYRYWYTRYDIDKELFCDITGITSFVYNYLKESFGRGTGTIDDLLSDPNVTDDMREKINNYKNNH